MEMAEQKSWRCLVCGYIHIGPKPPDFCPVCGSPASEFEEYSEPAAAEGKPVYKQWRCLNCGYIHDGESPPATCPVCGVPSERFQPFETEVASTETERSSIRVLIIGTGIAGISAAESIRKVSSSAPVQLVSMDKKIPYYRLNLTRYLAGEIDSDALPIHPESWYEENGIDLIRGIEVTELSPFNKEVDLSDGRKLSFDRLILAMGSHPFIPPVPGTHLDGVVTLRTAEDAQHILDSIEKGNECVVIGGGILGLETAGALSKRGADVSLFESHEYLMPRQLNKRASVIMKEHLSTLGIKLLENARTKEILGDFRAREVLLESGQTVPAELVIITTGVRPNTYLPRKAKLDVNRGILVNNYLETSLNGVYAVGDVAEHNGMVYGAWSASQYQGSIGGSNALDKKLAFGGLPRSNTIKVLGVDLFSIGQFEPIDGSYLVKTDMLNGDFHHFVFLDGKLVGSILLGNTSIGSAVKKAIEGKVDFGQLFSDEVNTHEIVEFVKELE
jgi:nitrite reductase (NADH) large subunit